MWVDIGSGYNPAKGYIRVDENCFAEYKCISDLQDKSIAKARLRNVIHHIENLENFVHILSKKVDIGKYVIIIDVNKDYYKKNLCLDYLWYRWLSYRPDIYISKSYKDPQKYFENEGFSLVRRFVKLEKEYFIFRQEKNNGKDY